MSDLMIETKRIEEKEGIKLETTLKEKDKALETDQTRALLIAINQKLDRLLERGE